MSAIRSRYGLHAAAGVSSGLEQTETHPVFHDTRSIPPALPAAHTASPSHTLIVTTGLDPVVHAAVQQSFRAYGESAWITGFPACARTGKSGNDERGDGNDEKGGDGIDEGGR